MEQNLILKKIRDLKLQKNAVILGHFYQIPEIQDISDYIGDSLYLAQMAEKSTADIIILAGVYFMAETAKLLNPTKKVLIPDKEAGCSLADSCPAEEFKKFKALYPEHIVITYINSSLELKTLSDITCTSSNAVKIVNSLPKDQPIIFAPDRNLGGYINTLTGRNMILWNGSCEIHNQLTTEKVIQLKQQFPKARIIAHPECKDIILKLADFIGSTSALLNYTMKSEVKEFIVATETGIIHQMQKHSPDKVFHIVPADDTCSCNDCAFMKLNTLEKVLQCLETEQPEIIVPIELYDAARKPIIRMLELS